MNKRGLGERILVAAISAACLTVAIPPGQGASAARVGSAPALPQTYLLRLDAAPTIRAFRQSRGEGVAAARNAAREQKTEIRQVQADVIEGLPADADVAYRTHSLLAGVGVNASTSDKSLLERIPGVRAVYPVSPKKLSNSYAMPLQAAPVAWESAGLLGQGQTIAVIDTGLDYTHSNFGGPGTAAAYDEAHAAEDQPVDEDLFSADKFAGGIDLVGDEYNADPDSESYQPVPHPDPNPLDCEGHGSHVAGSAAGYGVNSDGSTYASGYQGPIDFDGMRIGPGMAPEAQIYAIKVFGCEGSTNVVAEAIDRAVDPNGDGDPSDRVDVINMSLGSDFGSVQDGDSVAASAAVEAGVSVVTAAGNAGDHTDISGSPGEASRVLSVASSVDAQSKVDGAKVTIDGNENLFGITKSVQYDWKEEPDLSGPVVAAPPANETACDPYPDHDFDGEVVLVAWHDAAPECSSVERGENLAAAGATGFIFGSDSEVFSAGINGSDVIPGVLMTKSGSEAIRDALEDNLAVTVDGTEVNAVTQTFPDDDDKVSGFSSRGIHATGNIKPDVAAVGNTVFSTAVGTGSEGTGSSGTSMASPMVAGLAALVREANPDWNPLQVKADIMNTASHDLYVDGSANPSSDRYGPPRVGAGRVDAGDAAGNRVLAYDAEKGAVSVSFGPVEAAGTVTLSREVTVDNQSSSAATYDVAYDPINEVPGAEFSVSPAQLTVGPEGTATVTVRLEIDDPAELTKAVDPTVGRDGIEGFPRETLAEAFGRLLLDPVDPGLTLRVPVYASPRPASGMTQPDSLEIHRTAATADQPDQIATFELSGEGVGGGSGDNGTGDGDPDNDIFSIAAGFELQATSGKAPECSAQVTNACWRLPEERDADLRMVGYTSNAQVVGDPASQRAYFAFAVDSPWAIPSDKMQIQVDLDVDSDGSPDLFLFNGRLGEDDTFISILFDPSKEDPEDRVIAAVPVNGRFGNLDTALYDSDVMVLPVPLDALAAYGITPSNPWVRYGVETYSAFSPQAIDLIGVDPDSETGELLNPLSANLFRPGITVTDENGAGPLIEDQPGREVTVTRNVASTVRGEGKGLMMVHFHNRVGSKAQVVGLRRAATRTGLIITPGSLTAKVDATTPGLPAPKGNVTFWVDGKEVGRVPVQDGSAMLARNIPHGATHEVEARYSGDVDFEGSSDSVERADPVLKARVSSRRGKNRRGWYRTPVTVSFVCETRGSDLTEDCPYPRRLIRDGRGISVTRTIVAFDGGRATAAVRGIRIDRTRPTVRIRGVKRERAYRRIRKARCVARDRTSGVLRCRMVRKRRGKRVIYTAYATDKAGNRRVLRIRTRLRR